MRTAKIVAGHEAKLTNELLQAMASVAEQQLDWRSAVEQVLAAEAKESTPKETKPKEAKTTSKQISPRGKEEAAQRREKRISPQEQKVQKRSTPPVKDKDKDKEKEKPQRRAKPSPDAESKPKLSRQSSKQKSPSPVKLRLKQKKQNSIETEIKPAEPVAPAPMPKPASPVAAPKSPSKPEPAVEPPKLPTPELPPEPESRKSSSRSRRSSASQSRQLPAEVEPVPTPPKAANDSSGPATPSPTADANNNTSNSNNKREREGTFTRENSKESNGSITRPRTSLRPPSARPASARPGAPRRRNVEIVLQPNDQVKMSGINVKLETFGDFDDDGENLVIIEDANAHDIEAGSSAPDNQPELDAQQGRLVQQILETQKELVQQPSEADAQQKNSNPATRQSSARQVNDLRDIIQTLTKSVNPLGKLLDFIPEDIDAMQLELTMWRDTYTQSAMELKRELSLTASATEPMKQQLLSIEASIVEYRELIDESRNKILQNNERILKMLMEQWVPRSRAREISLLINHYSFPYRSAHIPQWH